jgi:hypothetical protein
MRRFLDGKEDFFTHLPGYYKETYKASGEQWGEWAKHQSKDPSTKVRGPCRECNHHWMSDLENAAAPLLTPMIRGEKQGLDIEQEATVARWAAKTAMVWDQLVPEEARLWSRDEHRWIMENPTPPPDTAVRLGHYVGGAAEFIEHKRVALFWEAPPDSQTGVRPDAHRTLMVVGKLVLEVRGRSPHDAVTLPGHDVEDLLMPIWPTSAVRSWPPRLAMSDRNLQSLHEPNEPA